MQPPSLLMEQCSGYPNPRTPRKTGLMADGTFSSVLKMKNLSSTGYFAESLQHATT